MKRKSDFDCFLFSQDTDDSLEKEKLEIFKRLQEKKQQLEAYEKERQSASLSLHDQDSDMPDIDNETFPGVKDIFYSPQKFLSFIFHVISPDDFSGLSKSFYSSRLVMNSRRFWNSHQRLKFLTAKGHFEI